MDHPKHQEPLWVGRAALAKQISRDWLVSHRKMLLILTLFLIPILCILTYCCQKWVGKSSSLANQHTIEEWLSTQITDAKSFQPVEKSLKKDPQLQAKFSTLIAQRLLAIKEEKKAAVYAKIPLQHAGDLHSSYYNLFTSNTFLIASGKYEKALKNAIDLKTAMNKDQMFWQAKDPYVPSGSILYAYNLLRIAALERQIGSVEGELAAWAELMKEANWEGSSTPSKTYDKEAYALLADNFTQGEISLVDYIHERRKMLTQATH